tara:strand:+ start:1390 stop:1833 length:444 start_codon:yes stop_codon:yes gene_type:complete
MKLHTVVLTLFVSLSVIGCGHHKHHREEGEKQRRHSEEKREHKRDREHRGESLTGKVIRYPFRMTGYAIAAPFHPFKATRKAVDATLDVPEKAVKATAGALFGSGEGRAHRKHHRRDRDEEHGEQEKHDKEEKEESDSEEHGEEGEK